jgi:hypothetical protein
MCRGVYRASIRACAVMVWFWLHLARTTKMRGLIEELRHELEGSNRIIVNSADSEVVAIAVTVLLNATEQGREHE